MILSFPFSFSFFFLPLFFFWCAINVNFHACRYNNYTFYVWMCMCMHVCMYMKMCTCVHVHNMYVCVVCGGRGVPYINHLCTHTCTCSMLTYVYTCIHGFGSCYLVRSKDHNQRFYVLLVGNNLGNPCVSECSCISSDEFS